jgi:hypothetical protein
MSTGKELENAVKRAAVEYRKRRRCVLLRQHTGVSNVGGYMQFMGVAPLDFVGVRCDDGPSRAIFVECKSTELASLPVDDDHFGAHQVAAGNIFHDLGAEGWLVVEFSRDRECYTIPWPEVRAFFAAPWRKSLSLHFARAYGLLCPSTGGEASEPWKLWFLDGKQHEGRETAYLAVAEERARAAGKIVSLAAPEQLEATPTRGPEKLTVEERKARIRKATEDGIANASRAAGRPKFKRRRTG